jgi:maltose alpha-D-glucosyltransferase/alpha-amylase
LAASDDSIWYKDAIIYQLHVRAFQDSNGDGVGDFRGLMQRLDYLQELRINTIWLLPFFPSPLRDDGYDISDYTSVHHLYGNLDDFRQFLAAAHERGIRVVIELVLNHTSDQHPWFQEARNPESPRRDWYVWSDTDERYHGVRIIFLDTEKSNWSWDPVSKSYYWHRFFSHQPDLNYDNPAVREAIWNVMKFWLEIGVDGFRLDAVPYLVEREGTSCENLPETHEVLRDLRARLDREFPGRMLLAEANQWPSDVCQYFGDGNEFHMAFHFPLMPRMFMAVKLEDRKPIIDILQQTPDIPAACQWCIFLRNHDELTLEMVTGVERDYMYDEYARDKSMRLNLGIRRRLAPLMEGDRRRIELLNGLLMSLPGTPVIYYGDEIGMGENIYLGDRNGVRTPMQWDGRWNAGFSSADPERLYSPLISNPLYGYQSVNVESQRRSQHSLLSWMTRLIETRRASQIFSRGSIEFLRPANHRVLAYLREFAGEQVLVVNNLSKTAQPVELDLRRHKGRLPIEMFGKTLFPKIGELPYLLTLGPHQFYWFRLRRI